MGFRYVRSGSSNAEPISVKVRLANSATVSKDMLVTVGTNGFATKKATLAGRFAGVVTNIFLMTGGAQKTIPSSSFTDGIYTAPADNQTRADSSAWVETIIDPNAQFEADWDATPTLNSLLVGAYADVNTDSLTLDDATSTAPGTSANVILLSTNAVKSTSLIKFNPAENSFNS